MVLNECLRLIHTTKLLPNEEQNPTCLSLLAHAKGLHEACCQASFQAKQTQTKDGVLSS
jgi:hypothetical protein